VDANPSPHPAVRFRLTEPETIRLTLHDAGGRHVTTLWDGVAKAGVHQPDWSPSDRRSRLGGVYWIRLETEHSLRSARVVVLR
jgi:hypothetical protein